MGIKPGWETTEFWATVFTQFVGVLLTLGIMSPAAATAATAQASTVGGILLMLVSGVAYVASRTLVKHQAVRLAPLPAYATQSAPVAPVPDLAPYAWPADPAPEPEPLDSPPAPSYHLAPRPAIVAPVTVTLPTGSSI